MMNDQRPDLDEPKDLAVLAARYLDLWERNVSQLAVRMPSSKPADKPADRA